jgi:hypothetical protein
MKRVKLDMMKRNALIVLTNRAVRGEVDRDMVRARVEEIARDAGESELVRETGRVCLGRVPL